MMSLEKLLTETEQKLKESDSSHRRQLQDLGKMARKGQWEILGKAGVAGLLDEATALELSLEQTQEQIQALSQSEEDLDKLKDRVNQLGKDLSNLEKSSGSAYPKIGENLWGVYQENPGEFAAYGELFQELEQFSLEYSRLSQEIQDVRDKADKGFWNKMGGKGRALLLQTQQRFMEGKLKGLFTELGKKVSQSQLLDDLNPGLFEGTWDTIKGNRNRTRELQASLQELQEEETRLVKRLEYLRGEVSTRDRLGQLKTNLEESTRRLEEIHAQLGLALSGKTELKTLPEAAEVLAELKKQEKERKALQDKGRRIQAGIRADELERQIQLQKKQVEKAQEEIKRLEAEIQQRQTQIDLDQKNWDAEVKTRGKKEELLG